MLGKNFLFDMLNLNKYLKISSAIAITIGLTSVLSSCNNSDSASKENFTKIISEYIKNERICSENSTYTLPVTIFDKEITDGSKKVYANNLDFFSSIGLIKATKGNVSAPSPIIWVVNPPKPATTYTITEEGDKNSVHKSQGDSNTTSYGFCYAKGKELISIQSFESKVNDQNMEFVTVNFSYKPTGLANWTAKAPNQEIYNNQNYFDTIIVSNLRRGKGWYINDVRRHMQNYK